MRYACTKPTLQTVLDFLAFFWVEIAVAFKMAKKSHLEGTALITSLLPIFIHHDRERVAGVLSTCVTLHGGAPGQLQEMVTSSEDLARVLCINVLACTDLDLVLENIDLQAICLMAERRTSGKMDRQPQELVRIGTSDMEIACTILGKHFGCGPHQVTAWPFEAVMRAMTCIPQAEDPKKRVQQPVSGAAGDGQWVTASSLMSQGMKGVSVTTKKEGSSG